MARNVDKLKSLFTISCTSAIFFGGIGIYQGRSEFYDNVAMPLVRMLDAETAHKLGITALKWKLFPRQNIDNLDNLKCSFMDLNLQSPLGVAAGFDKQAEAVEGLCKIGFSFVEIGSVTPKPQPGNPKPRVFRLLEDKAVINRFGFNSDGHDVVYERIKTLKNDPNFTGIIGVNLGKNKESEDSIGDYIQGLKKFCNVADYFVINVSSPNTPGLRNLQNKKILQDLLTKLNEARKSLERNPPLLLKLAPDLTEEERNDIAEVVQNKSSKVDGLILSNTTIDKSGLTSLAKDEIGGVSGAPLKDMSTKLISDMYKKTKGTLPIIGVGGIFNGQDAYDKIKAGASLVQIYTSFIYHGPPIITKINMELSKLVEKDGYQSLKEAVGINHKK